MDANRPRPRKTLLPLAGAALASLACAGAYVATREPVLPVAPARRPELVELDRMIVSLADASGARYLRASLALEVEREPAGDDAQTAPAPEGGPRGSDLLAVRLRDRALAVLQAKRARELAAPEAKEALRAELARALSPLVEGATVRDVLFTDFLVQ
jgi:flagellar basal body-associated protein FliL